MSRSGSGSDTSALRQLELPAISLTGPGAVRPAPSAQARLSAAPATTGTVLVRPRRAAIDGRRVPTTFQEGWGCGSREASTPAAASSSVSQVRVLMPNIADVPASVQSVAGWPVRVRATYSDGCRNRLAAANTAGSCARIQLILAPVWKAAGT